MRNKIQNEMISVIVPVYNTEKYLTDCIESILSQTYQDIEVLLIDDGSQDKSGDICDFYQQKDARVKVIHKRNEGVSSARNKGLSICRGEYVTFVDADDYVDKDYLKCLYYNLQENNAEISVCNFVCVFEDGREQEENHIESKRMLLNENLNFCQNMFLYTVCGTLFKKENLENLFFSTDIFVGEDSLFMAEVIKKASVLYYDKKILYKYRMNQNSVMHVKNIKKLETVLTAWDRIAFMQKMDSIGYKSAKMVALRWCRRIAAEMKLQDVRYLEKVEQLRKQVKTELKIGWKTEGLMQKMTLLLFVYVPGVYFKIYKKKNSCSNT